MRVCFILNQISAAFSSPVSKHRKSCCTTLLVLALAAVAATVAALTKMLKFYVKVFKTYLYYLNSQMDLVYTMYT